MANTPVSLFVSFYTSWNSSDFMSIWSPSLAPFISQTHLPPISHASPFRSSSLLHFLTVPSFSLCCHFSSWQHDSIFFHFSVWLSSYLIAHHLLFHFSEFLSPSLLSYPLLQSPWISILSSLHLPSLDLTPLFSLTFVFHLYLPLSPSTSLPLCITVSQCNCLSLGFFTHICVSPSLSLFRGSPHPSVPHSYYLWDSSSLISWDRASVLTPSISAYLPPHFCTLYLSLPLPLFHSSILLLSTPPHTTSLLHISWVWPYDLLGQ